MTSHDVREMLDLPGSHGPRPAKKAKPVVPRTNLKGLQREVQSLGGDNPIAIVPAISSYKKRRLASRKPAAKWEFQPFTNSARTDSLQLRHWRRKEEAASSLPAAEDEGAEPSQMPEPVMEDSTFAKFNVRVETPQYSEEEYQEYLQSQEWSKHETDYLMEVVREYDLRWPVIWDRYEYMPPTAPVLENAETALVSAPKIRTMEELKARYYRVAADIMKLRKPLESMNQTEFDHYERLKNFNPNQETTRKLYAEHFFHRSKEEAKEEESLLLELKRIVARSERVTEERRELYSRLEAPPSTANIAVYSTSTGLQQLLQHLVAVDKKKRRPTIMGPDSGVSPASGSGAQSFDRRDSSLRDSISAPSGASKKGPAPDSSARQLSDEEKRLYGVSESKDRSASGPQFRSEKLNKGITSKSSTQQVKITSTIQEMNIPTKLIMPTVEVGVAWSKLVEDVIKMLELNRQLDKAKGELALAKMQKAEREKREEGGGEEVKEEGEGDGEGVKEERAGSVAPSARGGSVSRSVRGASAARSVSGAHKRSASVLSATSDGGTKRQKK